MSEKIHVDKVASLLLYLSERLPGWARSTLKERLKKGCIYVNGIATTQHNHPLKKGDTLEITATPKVAVRTTGQLDILYSDRHLCAINKPAGLLAVGNATETQQHALAMLRNQLSRKNNAVKLSPVHRIDRDTSGVLLFATSREMRDAVMDQWQNAQKTYLAIVEGTPPAQGTINQPLRLDEFEYRMHVGPHPEAKHAITHYQSEQTIAGRTLLRVNLETGRQHQIRAHMAWLGHPVLGDERYGMAGPRMGLHALALTIIEPATGQKRHFEAPVPTDFLNLAGITHYPSQG